MTSATSSSALHPSDSQWLKIPEWSATDVFQGRLVAVQTDDPGFREIKTCFKKDPNDQDRIYFMYIENGLQGRRIIKIVTERPDSYDDPGANKTSRGDYETSIKTFKWSEKFPVLMRWATYQEAQEMQYRIAKPLQTKAYMNNDRAIKLC
jgi:hypothetical protein